GGRWGAAGRWLMRWLRLPLFMTLLHLLVTLSRSRAGQALLRRRPATRRRRRPLSTAAGLGLSNWSFPTSPSPCESSAVLFILLFSLLFQRAALVLVVLLIAGGLFLFTYKATQFEAEGFAMVLGASFLGGVRWTRTQILLQKEELGLQNPIDTMFHLQPAMFLSLFPLFAVFEGLPLSASEKLFRFHEEQLLLELLGKLALGGVLAFGLGFSEFLLVSRTSSLTFSISGIFKEVFTLFLAAHLMGDQLTILNWLGFAVCLLGISLHVALKALEGSKGTKHPEVPGSAADLELFLLLDSQEEVEEEEEVAEKAPLC
uniref:Solute carrier family 35 member C2 n=1 Tax=Laticauda laticaudata TaxID=8630 RepID=A0A8C5RLR6_LATLA